MGHGVPKYGMFPLNHLENMIALLLASDPEASEVHDYFMADISSASTRPVYRRYVPWSQTHCYSHCCMIGRTILAGQWRRSGPSSAIVVKAGTRTCAGTRTADSGLICQPFSVLLDPWYHEQRKMSGGCDILAVNLRGTIGKDEDDETIEQAGQDRGANCRRPVPVARCMVCVCIHHARS